MVLLPILAVAVLLGVFAYWSWLQAKQRREDMAALAADLGWRFDPAADSTHDETYAHFELFRRGHSRSAYNTLTGALELGGRRWPAKAGDFLYKITTSDGKTSSTHTYRFSYLILHLPFGAVPDLLIRREGVFDKLAGVLGFDDIDFESEEFSRRFCVKSPDKRFAYAVVHPRMMELLLAEQPPAIDIERGRCCISDGRHSWSVQEFHARLGLARRFFERWPEHLLVDLEAH
jgi:hypothetical protein